MCSKPRFSQVRCSRVPSRSTALALACMCLLLALACGKKGDPTPPLKAIPAAVKDLSLHQQGQDFVLEFGYPKTTIAGGPLPGIARIELLELVEPPPPAGVKPEIDPRRFAAAARPSRNLNEADLAAATSGDRVFLRLPIEAGAGEPKAYSYGVRVLATNGEISGLSNVPVMVSAPPPEPPRNLTVVPSADGLRVSWEAPASGQAEAYNVYRRDARSRAYRQALRTVAGSELSMLDTSARFGQRFIYTVTTVSSREPLVESRLSGEAEVLYQDRFSPDPPSGLLALAEVSQVRLRWDPSPSGDTVGYHVYRRESGDFRRLTARPIGDREFLDTSVSSGAAYAYRVTAVDGQGNEGEPGAVVTVTVR